MVTIEISTHGSRLSAEGPRLKVQRPDGDSVFVPVEDVDLVVIEVPGVDVSGHAFASMAASGIPAMICDKMHKPIGWLQPTGVQSVFTPERARRQARLPERTRGRHWRTLVRAKVTAQAKVLARVGKAETSTRLQRLSAEVAEGDPSNVEATAARLYWPALFGEEFLRRSADPRAAALNFGYAILRSIVCRSLVASGLHPDLGVFHRSDSNGFNLADDLIEPYRPAVDILVHRIAQAEGAFELARAKATLAAVGERPVSMSLVRMRCRAAIAATASSFARVIDGESDALSLPDDFPAEGDDA